MSVTVADLLKLPSLREARVLAGKGGLNKPVTTISVLEYAFANEMQEYILNSIDFNVGELVISALAAAKDNVAAQCANIRRLADVGSPGLVLYYVGIILDKVDPRLLQLADELDFALICMPENRANLRYSEVISEVMEAIIRDRSAGTQYQSEVLEQVSRLPVYQRNMETVIGILSDRVHGSFVTTDFYNQVLGSVFWPRTLKLDVAGLIADYNGQDVLALDGQPLYVSRLPLQTTGGSRLWTYVFKQDEPLRESDKPQLTDILQLFINLWSDGQSDSALPELVRAILQDEPYKMRRIADVFNIDVASIHNMWIVVPDAASEDRLEQFGRRVAALAGQELGHVFTTVVADRYADSVVIFMNDPVGHAELMPIATSFSEVMKQAGLRAAITACHNLKDTFQCRRAWLDNQDGLHMARRIWPGADVYTLSQIRFALSCAKILVQGEEEVRLRMSQLEWLKDDGRASLCETLSVYLLDAGCDNALAAKILYLHPNTVKYRLARITEQLGVPVGEMPAVAELTTAVALRRILEKDGR